MIWKKSIEINRAIHDIVILEGEEPADVIYHTLNPLGITRDVRLQILDHAKRDGVLVRRDDALVFWKEINIEEEKLVDKVQFYDNLKEPVDVLYQFVLETFKQLQCISQLVSLHILKLKFVYCI